MSRVKIISGQNPECSSVDPLLRPPHVGSIEHDGQSVFQTPSIPSPCNDA